MFRAKEIDRKREAKTIRKAIRREMETIGEKKSRTAIAAGQPWQ